MTMFDYAKKNEPKPWEQMTTEEKKVQLYFDQKLTLDTFLAKHAITQAQYQKSLEDLTEKMDMVEVLKKPTEDR